MSLFCCYVGVSMKLQRHFWVLGKAFSFSWQIAELVKELRHELDELLEDKIRNPNIDLATCPRGSKIISTIVKLVSTQ